MANYRKIKARRNSTRCGMCKYYKKMGNSKEHFSHRDRVKLQSKSLGSLGSMGN